MADIVHQQLPEKNSCKDILDGVCVLKGAVEQFFNNREFTRQALADMFPCNYELRIVNAETSIPAAQALPEIAMSRSDIHFGTPAKYALSAQGGAITHPSLTVTFEIKTASYRMTEYMALELSQFLIAFTPLLREANLYLADVTCGVTKQFRDTTPNYFFSKVSVNAGVPLTTWNYSATDTILRSVSLNLNIRGGADGPYALT